MAALVEAESPHSPHAARLHRLRHLTANYRCMQGLRMIPFGMFMLLAAFTHTVWWPDFHSKAAEAPTPEIVLALLAGGAAVLLGRYYARTYGDVQGLPWS